MADEYDEPGMEPVDDVTDDELGDVLADFDQDELDELADEVETATRAYIGFDALVKRLMAKDPKLTEEAAKRLAAHIGRRKYSPAGFAALAAAGRAKAKAKRAAMRSKPFGDEILRGGDFYDRVWTLDDIEIVRSGQGGDGRTVSAYAAVYATPSEIKDQHGHYMEVIDRSAFRRTLANGDPSKRVTVLYNHGLGLGGEHHPLGQVPIGSPVEIRSDDRGLLTVTRFNRSELADAVLEAIKAGDIRGYSFRGRVYRSSPDRVPRIQRGGALPTITRMELGLSEYGPTPIPFYSDAGVVAIRSALPVLRERPLRERIEIIRALLDDEPEPEADDSGDQPPTDPPSTAPSTPADEPDPDDASPTDSDESLGTEDPPAEGTPAGDSEATRSMSQADIKRRIDMWRITRGGV